MLICNLSTSFDMQEPVSYGVAAVIFINTCLVLLLSIIAFIVWFQRLMLVQTAEAFRIYNSCLALNKLQRLFSRASRWVKVIVYNNV